MKLFGLITTVVVVTSCLVLPTQGHVPGPSNSTLLKRSRRYLDFTKGARMSWRCTVKNNILKVNTLWGYGFGFRANFPFPDKADRRRPFFKRDVFQGLSDVLEGHGFDGQACLLKSFCTAHMSDDSNLGKGMLFKLLKLLFTASLLVTEQASSSSDTDKEIAFISVNGSHLDVSKTKLSSSKASATGDVTVISRPGEERPRKRSKRYLDFIEGSRMIFRVNVKNNIIPKPTIWAHGYGFRCNYPIENNREARPFRRDTYDVLRELMDRSGFDGQACILKAYCAAHLDNGTMWNKGMLFKLMKYIFTLTDEDRRHFPHLQHDNCKQILHSHCPLSFNSISPYTDDL
ncbi:uncharacterized protein LOC133336017 [Musca vetustissima]|uniref:uncharacterized protein LOC133336017 n=1 Tax=Musca vetustissima TaxID=27455 RepID=UPI002AB6DA4E|nr:uncharacterized protein LOC133336017 [Musca vetustissima]